MKPIARILVALLILILAVGESSTTGVISVHPHNLQLRLHSVRFNSNSFSIHHSSMLQLVEEEISQCTCSGRRISRAL